MNKRASILDVGFMVIILFIAAIAFLAASKGYTEFVDRALNNTQINSSASAVSSFNTTKNLQSRYDYVIIGVLVGFILAIIISSWLVAGNPLYSFIYFVAVIIFIVVSIVFSYVWHIISTKAALSGIVSSYFPVTNFILDNFPVFVTVVGGIGMLVMFAKPYIQGEA